MVDMIRDMIGELFLQKSLIEKDNASTIVAFLGMIILFQQKRKL